MVLDSDQEKATVKQEWLNELLIDEQFVYGFICACTCWLLIQEPLELIASFFLLHNIKRFSVISVLQHTLTFNMSIIKEHSYVILRCI